MTRAVGASTASGGFPHALLPNWPGWAIPDRRRQAVPSGLSVAIRELSEVAPASAAPGAVDLAHADDATLALALQAEHPKAPAVAWARLSPMVRRILRRSFGPGADVEDLVQETFLLLFRRIESLREPSTLRAFIIGITVRVARAEIRRRRVRRWVGLANGSELPDTRVTVDDPDSREALARFYDVLGRINARDRLVFVLHHVEGLDVQAVADALGTSVPTVRRSLARGFRRVVLLAGRDPSLVAYVTGLDGKKGARAGR